MRNNKKTITANELRLITANSNDRMYREYELSLFKSAMDSANKGHAATTIFPKGRFQTDVCCRVGFKTRLESKGFKVSVGKISDCKYIEGFAKRKYHGKVPKCITYYLSLVWVGNDIMRLY